jgi:antitoxin component of MazEF toxin-antitoxin module
LTKIGTRLALVLDQALLKATGITASTTLDISTDGDVIVITPVRPRRRAAKLASALETINARYAGVFKRLAE